MREWKHVTKKQGDTYPVEGYRKKPSPLNKECWAKWGLTTDQLSINRRLNNSTFCIIRRFCCFPIFVHNKIEHLIRRWHLDNSTVWRENILSYFYSSDQN